MEHISVTQLDKYESILNEIDSEFKKHEQLKKDVETETNTLTAVRVAMEENFTKANVFKVLVKVFSSIFDLYYVYSDEISKLEFESLRTLTECKFYVVEIFIAKAFLQKVISQKWLLNVCIENSTACVSKTAAINKEHINRPVRVVLPFDISTEATSVNTSLFKTFDKSWVALKVSTIITDISYHFTSATRTKTNTVVGITRSYNTNIENLLKIPKLEYNFKCKCTSKHFFESVVKNCYHRLNPQIFSLFTNETPNIILDFALDSQHGATIKLNKQDNVLTIVSNSKNLHQIKKYFIEEIRCQKPLTDKMWLTALHNTKTSLDAEIYDDDDEEINPHNLKIIYEEFRKLIFDLTV